MNSCGVELFRCSGYFLALSALSGSLSSCFFPNFGGVTDLLIRICADLINCVHSMGDKGKRKSNLLGEAPHCSALDTGFRNSFSRLQSTAAAWSCFADLVVSRFFLRFRRGAFGCFSVSSALPGSVFSCLIPRSSGAKDWRVPKRLFSIKNGMNAKVKNNLLGEAPLCLAFGSGFRDLLSNLQTTSAARSCFADLSASWIYLGLVSWASTRILCRT